ncbi:hypothetical protein CSUB01_10358 [Colletotrichum sublineola]|uniref:HNH nuclease domain-containing protein n=1 Tax=Colletotrichum sublineola TaxID=1173701 RepID=A0A066XH97_COLSU|nr:hypothetical protein CSUB01_10358 [Colletotrichum sublineola]
MSLSSGRLASNTPRVVQTQNLVRDFFQNQPAHHATAVDEASLRIFLMSDKICSPRPGAVEYLDEHDTKMALIPQVFTELEALGKAGVAKACLWTALWTMPASEVEHFLEMLRDPMEYALLAGRFGGVNDNFPTLLKIFCTEKMSSKDTSGEDEAVEPRPKMLHFKRNKLESQAALKRDNARCVLTGSPNPEVCHIFPFSALNHQERVDSLLVIMAPIWGQDRIKKLLEKLTGRYNPGASNNQNVIDEARNMISLNQQMHYFWGRGYFALEPMGMAECSEKESTVSRTASASSTPTRTPPSRASKKSKAIQQEWSIRLRFHWLRATNVPELRVPVDFSEDPINKFQPSDPERPLRAVNFLTYRPIENGQIFTIKADSLEELPDYDILLLQWDILRMWRLAGGADPAMYPDEPYGDED